MENSEYRKKATSQLSDILGVVLDPLKRRICLPRSAPSKTHQYEEQTESPVSVPFVLVEVLHGGKDFENEGLRKEVLTSPDSKAWC